MNKSIIKNLIGGIAIVFAIIFPEPATITSWHLFVQQIVDFILNPYLVFLTLVGLYGYLSNLYLGEKDE